jgi:hypothetical protein
MNEPHDPEHLAKIHSHSRRVLNRLWFALAFILAVGGTIVWAITGNREHLYSGLFLAVFPLIGLVYNHFFLYNPRRDPVKTQRRLEELAKKQERNVRRVSLVNGTILLIASPLFILIGISAGAEYGVVGAVVGGVFGSVWLVGGILGFVWWRRSRNKSSDAEHG